MSPVDTNESMSQINMREAVHIGGLAIVYMFYMGIMPFWINSLILHRQVILLNLANAAR